MEWVIPCNPKYYDISSAFRDRTQIDWRQSAKSISMGDIVYIYVGSPVQEIRYKCRVLKDSIPASEADYTDQIYDLTSDMAQKETKLYMRLELICLISNISLKELKAFGMKGNIQGPRRVDDSIRQCLNNLM